MIKVMNQILSINKKCKYYSGDLITLYSYKCDVQKNDTSVRIYGQENFGNLSVSQILEEQKLVKIKKIEQSK
ncbi:hypothetical protein BpHYR1_047772 [Brachionus plicatilis]|uniref:Uncharacterized protein n=1 Tax=Brachionus plicatilis TaxID=10195 RepID=A0A3M7T8H2_BRAPC|nr:hypothetical protein BpHYR1_047772 [Brachionus plicatilis]